MASVFKSTCAHWFPFHAVPKLMFLDKRFFLLLLQIPVVTIVGTEETMHKVTKEKEIAALNSALRQGESCVLI